MSMRGRSMLNSPEVVTEMAIKHGVCVRPLLKRMTDTETGAVTVVPLPCGSTRESRCVSCATKARRVRMQQCREGWHLTQDPEPKETKAPDPDEDEADEQGEGSRRVRSTRRRQDAPDLPRVAMDASTVGREFTTPSGKTYRPSMFVTLTLPSYGRVNREGVPRDPDSYDYRRAALDAMHFPKVVDRFWQNLRRSAGYKVQYFATVEAQRRLAPHLHAGLRGAIPREVLRKVAAATYHQIWWPPHDEVIYQGDRLPVWDEDLQAYVDPVDGVVLTPWAQALDEIDDNPKARPAHVVRLGSQVDIQGIIAESGDADARVGYLCKYLTKSIAHTHGDEPSRRQQTHMERLHDEVRYLPCSPLCTNWLRYGIQPANPVEGMVPGECGKAAHDFENLGLGGRRVLVSRAWTGKTLTTHRADRADVVRAVLESAGVDVPDMHRFAADRLGETGRPRFLWESVETSDVDLPTYATAVYGLVRERMRWRAQYQAAQQRAGPIGRQADDRAEVNQGEG